MRSYMKAAGHLRWHLRRRKSERADVLLCVALRVVGMQLDVKTPPRSRSRCRRCGGTCRARPRGANSGRRPLARAPRELPPVRGAGRGPRTVGGAAHRAPPPQFPREAPRGPTLSPRTFCLRSSRCTYAPPHPHTPRAPLVRHPGHGRPILPHEAMLPVGRA